MAASLAGNRGFCCHGPGYICINSVANRRSVSVGVEEKYSG